MVDRFPHPDLAEAVDFAAVLEEQAEEAGMAKEKGKGLHGHAPGVVVTDFMSQSIFGKIRDD